MRSIEKTRGRKAKEIHFSDTDEAKVSDLGCLNEQEDQEQQLLKQRHRLSGNKSPSCVQI